MHEKSSECRAHAGHVRATTDMCSRDLPVLQPALSKANGKSPSPRSNQRTADIRLANPVEEDGLPTPGGRLKFFKDGKFILELSHRRDGERTTWFPVPKKTFWPPASVAPSRQESSASLSVSDDNSSIQSSPWQRDHCWKQANPRRNISGQFNFYYRRPSKNRLCVHPRLMARKRRQPLDSSSFLSLMQESAMNYSIATASKANSNGNTTASIPFGRSLNIVVDKLTRLLDPNNVVSPRKRILRELERVTLEDQASKRRATPQPTNPGETPAPTPKQLSSYSITSILGEDKPSAEAEPGFLRNLLKPHDRQIAKYSPTNQPYSRTPRIEPTYATPANASSIHQPLYGLPMLPPAAYRAPPFCWMHYSPPIHYPPPLPLYAAPTQPHAPSPSPPAHHYKDYREQSLHTPPSGTFYKGIHRSDDYDNSDGGLPPLERSDERLFYREDPTDLRELRYPLRVSDMPLNLSKHAG